MERDVDSTNTQTGREGRRWTVPSDNRSNPDSVFKSDVRGVGTTSLSSDNKGVVAAHISLSLTHTLVPTQERKKANPSRFSCTLYNDIV